MKKSYARISYNNCDSIDYDYTICTWDDVEDNLFVVKDELEGCSQKNLEGDYHPSVTIEPVFMTDDEYEKWFIEYVEKNA